VFRYERLIYNRYLHLSTKLSSLEGGKGGRCLGLETLPSSCADCLEILGATTCWSPKDLSMPVVGYLYCMNLVIMSLLSKCAIDERTEGLFLKIFDVEKCRIT
jgi:hypothetical protein